MTKPEMPKKGAPEKMSRDRTKHVLLRMGGYILKYWPLFLLAIVLTASGLFGILFCFVAT